MSTNQANASSYQKLLILSETILAKFHHFAKSLQVFGKFLTVYFLFGNMLSHLWQICDIIGLIFHFPNGQILKNNLTIWSHCLLVWNYFGSFFQRKIIERNIFIIIIISFDFLTESFLGGKDDSISQVSTTILLLLLLWRNNLVNERW